MKPEWIIPVLIVVTILLSYGVKKAADNRNLFPTLALIVGIALIFPPVAILAGIYALIKWFR